MPIMSASDRVKGVSVSLRELTEKAAQARDVVVAATARRREFNDRLEKALREPVAVPPSTNTRVS
jgi:hypothetical protein